MKRLKLFLFFVLGLSLSMPTCFAQNTSTQGKEFWLSFMHNGFYDHVYGGWVINQVLISAKRDCEGTISNPATGWTEDFNVSANNITIVDIPNDQGYHNGDQYETLLQKAIKVESNDTISVYCTNIAYVSFDASFVLPVESLGDEYIIQSHDQSASEASNYYVEISESSAFLIVATEDNTVIEITPTCATMGGHQAGETFTVTMNAGDTYQVRSVRTGNRRDLSGTHILASDCKRIAVFNGNTLTCVPVNMGNGYDHVFEQAMPLRSWGKNFVVTNSLNRNRDFIKITSSADNNVITKNGEILTTLEANQSYTFYMLETEGSCYLQATQPSAVYLYNNSSYDQNPLGGLGDPSMVWIAPVEQRIDEVTFSTFDHDNIGITNHSVNIIVNTADIANVYFDGNPVSPLDFHRVNGNNEYSYARLNISHNVHHIACANGFNAHVYGFGQAKGYAYLVGSNAIDLSSSTTINDIAVNANDHFDYCINEPLEFHTEVNYQNYQLQWDFGDGTTSTDNPAVHTYTDKRVYEVALSITTDASGCSSSSSNNTLFYVDLTQKYVIENDETCAGELYNGYGFSNIRINNDTILGRTQANPDHPECNDSLLLYITAYQPYHVPISDSRCWHGEPGIYEGNGFSFEYNQPGVYDRQLELESVNGCDSIVSLHLTVADRISHEFSHHECGGSFNWDGEIYTHPGDYERNYVSAGGCDSIVTLHLTMGAPQYVTFDTITCGIFTWNGEEYSTSGTYRQTFETIDGCDSIVDCNLLLSGTVIGSTTERTDCDSFFWIDEEYTLSGHYEKTLSTVLGCDSIVSLDLNLAYTPDPTPIYPEDLDDPAPHWVVTATEFQINSYVFEFWDNNAICSWDSIHWEWQDPEISWVIEPDTTSHPWGKKVKVYVLNYIEDTIWLHATVYNGCAPQGVERRYWLVCSFYGTEENLSAATFDVVPNPNNGMMTLHFNHLTGTNEVKVYDMRGTLLDRFAIDPDNDILSINYDMKNKSAGLYYFVVTGKNGTLSKKVIVTR